jgi:hypothetical protein
MFLHTSFLVFFVFILQIHVSNGYNICSNTSSCKYTSIPEQIRIALRGSTGVTVSWRTNGTSDGGNDTPIPTVEYSVNKNFSSSNLSYGNSTNYVNETYVSWFHNCALNIMPNTLYYYHILRCLCVNESVNYFFRSQPPVGDTTPINIALFGDLGAGDIAEKEAALLTIAALTAKKDSIDLYQHLGDISYSDDHVFDHTNYESTWNTFQRQMQIITAYKFYMTSPGNHEVTCYQEGDKTCRDHIELQPYRNFTAYLNRFRMPGDESGGYKNMWFSYDFGSVHFIIINTETDFPAAPAGPNTTLNGGNFATNVTQLKWLENDLITANANRSKVPWIIMAGHRPVYTSIPLGAKENETRCNSCLNAFADLIYKYKVDFYFCGHVHWLERLFPVNEAGMPLAQSYYKQPGPIHVTIGAAGAPEPNQLENPFNKIRASAQIRSKHGFSILRIKNATDCQLEFYNTKDNVTMEIVNITRLR